MAALASAATGCYAYTGKVAPGKVTGRPVELALTDSGAVVLANALGPTVEAVRGALVADSGGSYLVSVGGVRRRNGDEADWGGQRVAVPHPLVSSVRERRFSRTRTLLVSAGVIGLVIGGRAALGGLVNSNVGGPEGGRGTTK